MKTKEINSGLFGLSLLLIFMLSCDDALKENEIKKGSENFISMDEAISFASVLEHPIMVKDANGRTVGTQTSFKDVKSVFEVPDANGEPSFYIINYEGDGFIIMSADDRANSIRAFSSDNAFSLNETDYPLGLVNWLMETSDLISDVRLLNVEETEAVAQSWDVCGMQMMIQPIDDGGDCGDGGGGGCQDSQTTVGPLMATTWGQQRTYNDLVENENCAAGTAPTGCVATAMAQIMYYHSFPNNYNWENMQLGGMGTMETARLMRDVGQAVDMNYTCTASGADMEDATSAFSNDFGYQNATYSDFNHSTVKQQLGWNRPVMLSGYRTMVVNCFGFFCSTKYENGHAWVCDGYRSTHFCNTGNTYLHLYMNWGWNGSLNGWFAYNRWNPGTRDYQYKKKMIYNIRP